MFFWVDFVSKNEFVGSLGIVKGHLLSVVFLLVLIS